MANVVLTHQDQYTPPNNFPLGASGPWPADNNNPSWGSIVWRVPAIRKSGQLTSIWILSNHADTGARFCFHVGGANYFCAGSLRPIPVGNWALLDPTIPTPLVRIPVPGVPPACLLFRCAYSRRDDDDQYWPCMSPVIYNTIIGPAPSDFDLKASFGTSIDPGDKYTMDFDFSYGSFLVTDQSTSHAQVSPGDMFDWGLPANETWLRFDIYITLTKVFHTLDGLDWSQSAFGSVPNQDIRSVVRGYCPRAYQRAPTGPAMREHPSEARKSGPIETLTV
jgi:hypothetical protein